LRLAPADRLLPVNQPAGLELLEADRSVSVVGEEKHQELLRLIPGTEETRAAFVSLVPCLIMTGTAAVTVHSETLADYYTAAGNPPGRWVGSGARPLGVANRPVTEAQPRLRPDVYPVNSASLLWAIADVETRREVEAAHHEAVADLEGEWRISE
jgi:hypothetical protein